MAIRPPWSKSLSRAVWRASLTPALGGLVAFSFVLVAFGATVYVSAVPSMIVNDIPDVGLVFNSSSSKLTSNATGDSFDEGIEALEEGVVDELTEPVDITTNPFGSIALSSPFFDKVAQIGNSITDVTEPSASGGTGFEPSPSGGGGEPQLPSGGETPTGLSEDEEQDIYSRVAGLYQALGPFYEKTVDRYKQFFALYNSASSSEASSLRRELQDERGSLVSIQLQLYTDREHGNGPFMVPEGSRYYNTDKEVRRLYDEILNAHSLIMGYWANIAFGGDGISKLQKIEETMRDGQSIYLLDFYESYPKVTF